MKRALVVVAVVLTSFGFASAASAEPNQPGRGENSTGRNDAGFGGGPHCHVLVVDSAQDRFELIRVFPSHTAHVHSGLVDGVFVADPDCDGVVQLATFVGPPRGELLTRAFRLFEFPGCRGPDGCGPSESRQFWTATPRPCPSRLVDTGWSADRHALDLTSNPEEDALLRQRIDRR